MLREILKWARRVVRPAGRAIAFLAIPAATVLISLVIGARAQNLPDSGSTSGNIQQILQGLNGQSTGTTDQSVGTTNGQIIIHQTSPQAGPAPVSRLEQILSSRAGVNLKQFGYDQLGAGRDVLVPQTGAVTDDYILGPGDQIDLSLRGQENSEFRAVVDRNGRVILPRLNPIMAAGRTFGDFRAAVTAAAQRAFISTQVFVSVAQLRQISVTVAGDVNNPGVRFVTGLSTVVDAILLSGGVDKTGSLRNVKLIRAGQQRTIDLYAYLTQRGNQSPVLLSDGDRIVVPALGATVAATGWVRRPGIYEVAPGTRGMSVRSLIALAGGTEVRSHYRLSILRTSANGSSRLVGTSSEGALVNDSEILFVQPAGEETVQNATLSGATPLAGVYSVGKVANLSDVLSAPGALGTNPYTLLGVVVRRDPATQMRVMVPFTPIAVIKGRENMSLVSGDMVRVFSAKEARLISAVVAAFRQRRDDADARLRSPTDPYFSAVDQANQASALAQTQVNPQSSGQQTFPKPLVINDERQDIADLSVQVLTDGGVLIDPQAAYQAQNAGQSGYQGNAILPSSVTAQLPSNGQNNSSSNLMRSPALQGLSNSAQANALLGSNAGIASNFSSGLPGSPSQQSSMIPSPTAGANSQFSVPATPMASNFEDQTFGNGIPTNLEVVTFGQLSRQLNLDALTMVHFFENYSASIEGSVQTPGDYLVGPNVTLQDIVAAAGGADSWTDTHHAEIISTTISPDSVAHTERKLVALDPTTLSTLEIHPRDEVRFSEVVASVGAGSITLQGQVRHPGVYRIERGERLSDVLLRAGGLTDVAYPYGTVFLRKSAAAAERINYDREAKEIADAIATGLTRQGPSRVTPDAMSATQLFIQQIKSTKALGRITVTADPAVLAANPQRDVLLEAGDVVVIPQRPSTVSVMGQVSNPGSFPFDSSLDTDAYIDLAGGLNASADSSLIYVVYPDGSAHHVERSWLKLQGDGIPPGSTIYVPRDFDQVDLRQVILDISSITSQIAVAAASLAYLTRIN